LYLTEQFDFSGGVFVDKKANFVYYIICESLQTDYVKYTLYGG